MRRRVRAANLQDHREEREARKGSLVQEDFAIFARFAVIAFRRLWHEHG
jgi:hypothetical protein